MATVEENDTPTEHVPLNITEWIQATISMNSFHTEKRAGCEAVFLTLFLNAVFIGK